MFAPKNCQARACHFCSCSKVECCRASACCDELSFRASREVKASRMPRASREHIDRSVFVCVLFDVAWRAIRLLDPRRPPSAPAAREAFEISLFPGKWEFQVFNQVCAAGHLSLKTAVLVSAMHHKPNHAQFSTYHVYSRGRESITAKASTQEA